MRRGCTSRSVVVSALIVAVVSCAPASAIATPDLIHDTSSVIEAPPTDSDGVVEPGEGFTDSETLRNRGDATATGITGTLSTSSADITLTNTASAYPDIAAASTGVNATPFTGHLSATNTCGATLPMSLGVSSGQGAFTVPAYVHPGAMAFRTNEGGGISIPDDGYDGTLGSMASSSMTVPSGGTITDLDVAISQLDHEFIGDLTIKLKAPDNTLITLMDRIGSPAGGESSDDFRDATLDDQAPTSITTIHWPTSNYSPAVVGRYKPNNGAEAAGNLASFNGKSASGTWTLYVGDNVGGDTGKIKIWGLDIVTQDSCAPLGDDTDSDGVADSVDNCPNDANAGQEDADADTDGDVCDTDDDNDGAMDDSDACALLASTSASGCPAAERSLKLAYSAKKKRFKGKVTGTEPQCVAAQDVSVWKQARGPDKLQGAANSTASGSYAVAKKASRGRYYSTVDLTTIPDVADCESAKSPAIKR